VWPQSAARHRDRLSQTAKEFACDRLSQGCSTARLTKLTKCWDDGSVVAMNLYQAKTQLSVLVDRAAAGQETVIAKNGRFKGKIWMSDDFDAPMPDVPDAFENSVIE
jgi:hypothetical protein